ncbi:MAG: hypothetical protein AB1431_09785 [Pseudomonadota bacterium]|nr:hypothetical protein [Pseudomonadota bacterium]
MAEVERAFKSAREYIDWASDALRETEALCRTYYSGLASFINTEEDPSSGFTIWWLHLTKPLDRSIARKATEALLNVRHGLDQAAHACYMLINGPPKRDIYFPWGESRRDSEVKIGRLQLPQPIAEAMVEFGPFPTSPAYTGGDDMVRALAKIANRKHTIGIGTHVGVAEVTMAQAIVGEDGQLIMPALKWDSEQNRGELLRMKGDVKVPFDFEIDITIMISDQVLRVPLGAEESLKAFADKAGALIRRLEQECRIVVASS